MSDIQEWTAVVLQLVAPFTSHEQVLVSLLRLLNDEMLKESRKHRVAIVRSKVLQGTPGGL